MSKNEDTPWKVYNDRPSPSHVNWRKIIAEIVVKMNIVTRIKLSSKLKNSTSKIGYYFYTNRCK